MRCATGGLKRKRAWRLLSGSLRRVLHFCRESPLLCGVLWSMCRTPRTPTILQEAFGSTCCFSPRVYQDWVIGREVGKTLRPLIRGSPGRRLHSSYRVRSRVCGISNRALQGVPPLITSLDIYLILKLLYGNMVSYCPPPIEGGAV